MKFRLTHIFAAALLTTACGAADGPGAVAQAFWTASKEGDIDRAKTYVAEGSKATMSNPERSKSVREFSLGEVTVDGDRATVETTVAAEEMELAFETVLIRQEGDWKVDLDATTDEMMKSLFGTTMGDFTKKMGEAIGDAVGESMKAVAEGMAEGLKAMGEALSDSLKTGRRR
jgi:predicted  nucleic acid-binding Zn-ribbon protein